MAQRWTQAMMKQVAAEERANLGLTAVSRLDPYALAEDHGIAVVPIDRLAESGCPDEAIAHFTQRRSRAWSAALVRVGPVRFILENPSHVVVRRRASVAHELSHHLLEHEFNTTLLAEDGHLQFDPTKEKQATFLAAELLVPYQAALKMAFADRTNQEVARAYGVSSRFAQMCMKGARVHAANARAKQAAAGG